MIASVALAIARQLSTSQLRALADVVFVRTKKELASSCADPASAQRARLRAILSTNASTEFGRAHDFASITGFDEFRARVPLSTWDTMAPAIERMVAGARGVLTAEDPIFYATTSGTTGRRKLLPVTSAFVEECRAANRVLYRTMLREMPALLHGKRLAMRSPVVEELRPGVRAGSITAALGGGLDDGDGAIDAVPVDVFALPDFTTRYFLALRFAAQERITVSSAVNPSTLHLFARTLATRAHELADALEGGRLGPDSLVIPDDVRVRLQRRARVDVAAAARIRDSVHAHGEARMRDVFPHLAGLVCWKGGSAPFFLARLSSSYGELPVLDYGYVASEGLFGAPLSTEGAASLLIPHGHVVELIPEHALADVRAGRASTVLLHEAQPGHRYWVVVTTSGGLYRYEMNDLVEVVGLHDRAPLVVFRHKGGTMSSITGEKLGESHVVDAMHATQKHLAVPPLAGFVVAPQLPASDDDAPSYVLALDVEGDAASAPSDDERAHIADAFDAALRRANEEYDAKRGSLRLGPVVVVTLPHGAVVGWRARRVQQGAPDAHVKVPHLSPDGRLLVELGLGEVDAVRAAALPCQREAR